MEEFNIKDFFRKEDVLDKGYVELIDGMVLDPRLKIVNAARVSFNKESKELSEKDIKLINFLQSHKHYSTFRHSYFTLRIKAPLCVFRQWWKHSIACEWLENENIGSIELPSTSWNEMSGRYVEFEPEFYIPKEIRGQSKDNKQGSEGVIEWVDIDILEDGIRPAVLNSQKARDYFEAACMEMYHRYKTMIANGVAKEQARMILPQNIYSECILTWSLQAILYFLELRVKSDAQEEIRDYAIAVKNLILPIFEGIDF